MTNEYDFLGDYPLDYLIRNMDKIQNFYVYFRNLCLSLSNNSDYDGHALDDSILDFAWNSITVVLWMTLPNHYVWMRYCDLFCKHFNHSGQSDIEFTLWIFSDQINELRSMTPEQLAGMKTYIDISSLGAIEKHESSKSASTDEQVDFFQNYAEQGGGKIERPEFNDLQAFAKEALKFIEKPRMKEAFGKIKFVRFHDWLPEDLQEALDNISKLTLRDGKMLIAAKPLVEHFGMDYSATQRATVDAGETEKTKQKAHYRLTKDDIKFRKEKVKEVNKIRKDNPRLKWSDIAKQVDVPERTLRDWRHNNY